MPTNVRLAAYVLLVSSLVGRPALGQTPSKPMESSVASQYFKEARAASERDKGKLWIKPLGGPLLFVDPATHKVVANQSDHQGFLTQKDDVFVGQLPEKIPIANNALNWGGVKWAMIVWPFMTPDKFQQVKLMTHESFHRVMYGLKVPVSRSSLEHLDTLEGRLWLQLEWRALRRALAGDGDARHTAIADALTFRAYRHSLFPEGIPSEHAFEMNEGLAEYTGFKLSAKDEPDLIDHLVKALDTGAMRATFMGSFAYSSGPAYGELLDLAGMNWRKDLTPQQDLGELLQSVSKITLPSDLKAQAEMRATQYEGDALRSAETARDVKRQKQIAAYRKRFLDSPILVLPLTEKRSITLVSSNMITLGSTGTVYPTSKIIDEWGVLEVSKGVFMVPNEEGRVIKVYIVPPDDPTTRPLKGEGWTLQLAPGWGIVPGSRGGDYLLKKLTP